MPKLTRTFSARILAKGDDDGDHHDEHPDHWDHGRDHKHDNDVHPEIHNLKRGESALSAGATGHPEDHGIDLYKEHLEAEESFEKSRKNVRQLRADARERRATLRKERRAAKQAAEAEKHEEFEAVKRNERRQSAAAAAAEASEKSRRRYSHRVQRMNQRRAKVARMEVEPLVFNSERCGCGIPVGILGLSAVAATKLGLKEAHLRKMFQLFQAFDKDDSGCMSHGELIDLMDVPDTEFVRVMLDRVIFSAIEVRMEEDIDFDEFVLACCVVCTSSKQEMAQTLFHIFDDDDSGFIDQAEMKRIVGFVKDAGSTKLMENMYNEILSNVEKGEKLYMDKFLGLSQQFPRMFDPVFRMRSALMKMTLSKKVWTDVRKEFYRKSVARGEPHSFQQQIFIESMKLYAKHHKHHGDGDSAMLESPSGEEEDEAGEGEGGDDDA